MLYKKTTRVRLIVRNFSKLSYEVVVKTIPERPSRAGKEN